MSENLLGIGALSRACGVPIETLRTWERRYKFPEPVLRTGTSHRRYPLAAVDRLKRIKLLVDHGHKPRLVVGADVQALRQLLALDGLEEHAVSSPDEFQAADETEAPETPRGASVAWLLAEVIDASRELDAERLDRLLAQSWEARGALAFLEEVAGPLLREIGTSWAAGRLTVSEEHFASDRVRALLTSARSRLSVPNPGKRAICAALPGDQHDLGACMAALVLALGGYEVIFLGANTPVEALVGSAHRSGAQLVAISVAEGYPEAELSRHLGELAASLPPQVELFLGGVGVPCVAEGVRRPGSWSEFAAMAGE